MVKLSELNASTAKWRQQLRKNELKTRAVIAAFIGLYLLLGILVDLFIYSQTYDVPVSVIFQALLTFQLVPYATIITTAIAIISLLITYAMHDRIMLLGTQYHQVKADATDIREKQFYNTVEELKIAAGLAYMPKVFIIEADYMNAFASGYSERSAMVAITRGLLNRLERDELQAVMAHELSHIRHHDIKLTLMVTVLSNIMLIAIDILFYSVLFGRQRRGGAQGLVIVILLLRYLLPLITILLGLFLSRTREYMADAGAVALMRNNQPLARALIKIQQDYKQNSKSYQQAHQQTAHEEIRRAAYLYDPLQAGLKSNKDFSSAFSTHPRLIDRLRAIGFTLK